MSVQNGYNGGLPKRRRRKSIKNKEFFRLWKSGRNRITERGPLWSTADASGEIYQINHSNGQPVPVCSETEERLPLTGYENVTQENHMAVSPEGMQPDLGADAGKR